MNGFILSLPLTAGTQAGPDEGRLFRLYAQGWADARLGMQAGQGAWIGQAGVCHAGPLQVLGLAHVNNRTDLYARLDMVQPSEPGAPALSDLDLIARLALAEPEAFAPLVSGAFALAVHDTRDGTTRIYRDHFGQIPLYYCIHSDVWTCGTDLRAVLHQSGSPLSPDTTRIADFLVGCEIEPTRTAFAGVHRLRARHCARLHPGRAPEITRYTTLSLPSARSADMAGPALRTHLAKATCAAFHTGAPTGAMLSGGLDSSTLVALAVQADPIPALSFIFPSGAPHDERIYIDAVNAALPTRPILIPVDHPPDLAKMDEVIDEQMDLFLAPGIQQNRHLYIEARAQGLTRLIDGHAGDEVVSHGFERLTELASKRQLLALWREMRGPALIYGEPFLGSYILYLGRFSGLPQRSLIRRAILRLGKSLTRRARTAKTPFNPIDLLSDKMRTDLDPAARYAREGPPNTRAARKSFARQAHLNVVTSPLSEHALEVLFRAAQPQGIFPHYPFLDSDVVRFCLSLPSEAKLHGGMTRWVLREAMRDLVPDIVRLRRTKADFTPEFLVTLRNYLAEHDPPDLRPLSDIVDLECAARLFAQAKATPDTDIQTLRAIWRLIVLSFWWRGLQGWISRQDKGTLL